MKVIYVSSLTSKSKMNKIINEAKSKPLQSIQKFHRLICEGFAKNNVEVKTISSIPMSRNISNNFFWFDKKEYEQGVEYTYIPFVNIKYIRQIFTLFGTINKVIKECKKNKKNKIFICDILNTTIASTTLILSKIFKFKCIAIVTDLPKNIGKKNGLSRKINEKLQTKYDAYIILTNEMNKVVNPKNKPNIVIEGLADSSIKSEKSKIEKYEKKVCIYAGGLYEKYGVKNLIDAIKICDNENIELHLYGSGDLENYIKSINNTKIKYFGVVKNDIIIQEERRATLLINPRFTKNEYTKYSFPSKNLEYMASGTPILTTRLAGMPKEYYKYIYTFDDESVEGMKRKILEIIGKPIGELEEKGKEAKDFVLEKKNNIIQTKKIIEMIYGGI